MNDPEGILTDLDDNVKLRVDEGKILVEVTAAGFRQPLGVIAGLIVEVAAELPRPGAGAEGALSAGIETIGRFQEAAATGGYDAMAAMMRGRLGIETPDNNLGRDPELDRIIAGRLDSVLKSMRSATAVQDEPRREVLTAEVTSAQGDLSVTSSTDRVIADVHIGPDARGRGIDGLGEAITELVAAAQDELKRRSQAAVRERLPEGIAETIDAAPAAAESAARESADIFDIARGFGDDVQRKAGRE
ncbi:hypothetical protein AB0B28_02150 [Glycomyces sp. NPDC046736]|uniref:hypothetical protein n=1 Tax=Glycomyces sp. NPDC046736 TaxID=3155615 RepID=UPI0033C9DEF5